MGKFSVGVLVVGSLMWDDAPERAAWRDKHLDMSNKISVAVPIRYGRRSVTRGNTYTIVLTAGAGDETLLGTAWVVPIRKPLDSPHELWHEAEAIWAAERKDKPNGRISANWGAVACGVNEESPRRAAIIRQWRECVKGRLDSEGYLEAAADKAAMDQDAVLSASWPTALSGDATQMDVLLATVTAPTLQNGRFASPREIAKAWKSPRGQAYQTYFWSNRDFGITTPQDEELQRLLES